jgi:ABC-type polysaccharide/polyol phosphate transport system ATPase subunit
MRSSEPAISLKGISKRYFLNRDKPLKLSEALRRPRRILRQTSKSAFWALQDITFDVRVGETVGIIGPNGSGKSTLLYIMLGISPPTSGEVKTRGRIAGLLELGAAFHQDASGRDNAYLNALFLGLPKDELDSKLPEIIEFAGLEQFIDQPIRTYSTGMRMRLGYSVAVHVRPDILLVDEVLAVGDADFQEKCFDHFAQLKQQSTTIILVSHDLGSIQALADRVILIEHGQVVNEGDPTAVCQQYLLDRYQESSPAAKRAMEHTIQRALDKERAEARRKTT